MTLTFKQTIHTLNILSSPAKFQNWNAMQLCIAFHIQIYFCHGTDFKLNCIQLF